MSVNPAVARPEPPPDAPTTPVAGGLGDAGVDGPASETSATNAPATNAPATNAPATATPANAIPGIATAPATPTATTDAAATDAPAHAPATATATTDAAATDAPAHAPATATATTNAAATDASAHAPATATATTDTAATDAPAHAHAPAHAPATATATTDAAATDASAHAPRLIPDPAAPAPSPAVGNRALHREEIPWRIIWTAIGIVLAAGAAIELVLALQRIIELLVISSFLAVVLSPAVKVLIGLKIRRGLATSLVFGFGMLSFVGLGYLFIHPIYREAVRFANDLPDLLARTQAGKGRLGELIARYHLQQTAATEVPKIRSYFSHLGGPALTVAKQVLSGLGGLAAVGVVTFLLLLEGPSVVRSTLKVLPPRQARRVRHILEDVAKSVTGYVLGNVATSIIAGVICGVSLIVLRIPFAIVFGVWVAMVDLLPLVGGLLAGVPTVVFAALHSPTDGVIMLIIFLVYQQIENHILNPVIMSRTVRLNPLWVILSVLAGAQLGGIVGALLAIPAAGTIHVILRDVWDQRRGQPKTVPTVGPEETTVA